MHAMELRTREWLFVGNGFSHDAFDRFSCQRENRQVQSHIAIDTIQRVGIEPPMSEKLTHVDPSGRPTMVDVGTKQATRRLAVASATVRFPPMSPNPASCGLRSAKGPIIDTAIIAGTMAVKRTHELIPFCHPLPIENCRFEMEFISATEL